MSVETGGSTTTPNSKLVGKTGDLLLKGLQDAYKGGVDVYDKPLYTGPSSNTQHAWNYGSSVANNLVDAGGFGIGQRDAMTGLGSVGAGYADIGANGGLTAGQSAAKAGLGGLGSQYAGLGTAYDPNSAAYKTLRQGVIDDTLSNLGSQFTASGRFGGGSYVDTASEGLGEALAGLDYTNMQNNVNNQYRSLDAQRGIFGDQFGMDQTGTQNRFGALAGQAAGLGAQFDMGQQALQNRNDAVDRLTGIGSAIDASQLASRMADYDLFTRKQDADWEALARASSILGGTAGASGSTTSNTVPWWAALLGGAATGASIFG